MLIRVFDLAGSLNLSLGPIHCLSPLTLWTNRHEGFTRLHWCVSRALEAHRKGKTEDLAAALGDTVRAIFAYVESFKIDIAATYCAKRQFNEKRADHKPENRAKAGGKKY